MEREMKINGKNLDLLYSIGADIEIDDEMTKVGAADFGTYIQKRGAKGYVKIAAIMSKWACIKAEKEEEAVQERELLTLNAGEYSVLVQEVLTALERGQKQDMELKESKNAESAAQ